MIPPIDLHNPVWQWWLSLTLVGVMNIALWFWVRRRARGALTGDALEDKATRTMLVLSGIYVFVCAFRGVMPRADVQRICLFDVWISTVFVGRTVATVAELAFVAQWSLALRRSAVVADARLAERLAFLVVPLIAVAECFSWSAVITTNYLGNSLEESLWTLTYTLVGVSLAALSRSARGRLRWLARAGALGCVLYACFMLSTDVPMYLGRLFDDASTGRQFLELHAGIDDLLSRWVVTHELADWRTEMPWMTLYFSIAVWLSIALCLAPLTDTSFDRAMTDPFDRVRH